MNFLTIEEINSFTPPEICSNDQKFEYINLETNLSLSCVYHAVKKTISENKELPYFSEYVDASYSDSNFRYRDRPITIGEENLLIESFQYLVERVSSRGNTRFEIAEAFDHATDQSHFINLLKMRIYQMVVNNRRSQNSEADRLFDRISEIFNSEQYCFHKEEDGLVYCLECREEVQRKIEDNLLENETFEQNKSYISNLFRRVFTQIRYNPSSKISQRIYSTEDLVAMVLLICKIYDYKFNVNELYEAIRELVVIWQNQQPISYDGVSERDLDAFEHAVGMYGELRLDEYAILDSDISSFINSLSNEQIYSILSIMQHPRFRTNRLLAQRIGKSEEYARQLKLDIEEKFKNFFEEHSEADDDDLGYAMEVIKKICYEKAGINE